MKSKDEQIKEIIANFDWVKVHKVFVTLKWEYAKTSMHEEGIPTIGTLINTAADCLQAVANGEGTGCGTGGFRATIDNCSLGLEFVVEDYFVEAEE